jgi:hypothetical protein
MLCALLIFGGPDFPGPLERLSPWLDQQTRPVEEVFASLANQRHRRFVKTHTPLDGLPWRDDVTYVVVGRDPRDVAVSLERHFANMDFDRLLELRATAVGLDDLAGLPARVPPAPDPRLRFLAFVERDDGGGPATLGSVLHHLRTGWERRAGANVGLFHYADYAADLAGEVLRLARLLDIPLSRSGAEALAPHAGLDRMRDRLGDVLPNASDGIWKDPSAFLRASASGEWRRRVTEKDMARYHERVSSLVPPDLAAWAHGGRLGSGVDPGSTPTPRPRRAP